MYYVVHKFPKLSKSMIHLGTHAHLIVNIKCKESLQEMKNMVGNEVCWTPTTTTLAIVLSRSKTFFFHHLFNEDGQGPVDQMLLKFVLLCPWHT
jgi:hypothetical protein